MSLVLDELPRDPDRLLLMLQQMTEVIAQHDASLASLQAERDAAQTRYEVAQAEIEKLRLLIRQLQRGRFGRRSEKLDPDQLQLGLEDLEQTVAAAEAAQEAGSRSSDTARPPRSRRRNLGALPAHLPRLEVLVALEDKSCPCCGGALHVIGEDTSEMLDIVPAQLRVKVIRRPRYGCRACEEAVVQAPAPERPITSGVATEALLAHVLVAKYADFLPLYRQAQIFARQGIELDRSTLSDWVGRACWWLEPLWRLLHRHVMGSTRIFADDTTLPVLDPGRGRTKTGRLWGYAVDDRPWCGGTPPAVGLPLRRGPQGRAPGRPPGRVHGHPAGGRLLRLQGPAGGPPAGPDQASVLLGALPEAFLRDPPGHRLAVGSGGAAADQGTLRHRGRDPRPPGRGPPRGPAGAEHAARGGAAQLAHCPAGTGLGQVRPGRGDPLRPAPLEGAGSVPGRRPARARHEHRRAGDPAHRLGAQEGAVR